MHARPYTSENPSAMPLPATAAAPVKSEHPDWTGSLENQSAAAWTYPS